jgi:glutaredoxin 3
MEVTVYTTPTCPYCHQVKGFLSQQGIKFTERDVSVDRAAATEMIQKTGQRGVPVTVIDDQVVIGFDRVRLEDLLANRADGSRPSLGVQVADASKFAQQRGAIPVFGALVGGVKAGSAGERLGLRQGDIITEINLRPVHDVVGLEQALSGLSPGGRVVVAFQRGQREFRSEAVL